MVTLDAAGTRAWTANITDNNISEVDLRTMRFVRTYAVPERPEGIAGTPDGRHVWVGSNTTGEVTVIDTGTGGVIGTLTGATFPYRLAVSSDGTRMAVVDGTANRLRIADVATHRYTGSIPLQSPRGVVTGADNSTAYVTLAVGVVAVVHIHALRALRTFAVQSSPDGIGVGTRLE
jgi:YVTN family beta-propeller protein